MTTAPPPNSQQLAVEVPRLGTLSLVFTARGDRRAHAIWLEPLGALEMDAQPAGGPAHVSSHASAQLPSHGPAQLPSPRLLLESVEGSSDEHWPASPPLQSLSIESFAPGTSVALLVGMAGNSHWSASIEPCHSPGGFLFDVACRTTAAATFLGSTYRLAAGIEAAPLADSPSSLTLTLGQGRTLRLTTEAAGPFPPPHLALVGNQLRLAAPASSQKTIRWKYRLELGGVDLRFEDFRFQISDFRFQI